MATVQLTVTTNSSTVNLTVQKYTAIAPFTTDESLFLDPSTNELRANVSTFKEFLIYTSGVQEFVLTFDPVKILLVSINGIDLPNYLTQWSIDTESKTITILDELEAGNTVSFLYEYYITN